MCKSIVFKLLSSNLLVLWYFVEWVAAALTRLLRASGGGDDDDEGIESDGDRDKHVESEEFLHSLDEQPSDEELDDDWWYKGFNLFLLLPL